MKRFRFGLEGVLRARSAMRRACESEAHIASAVFHESVALVDALDSALETLGRETLRRLDEGCSGADMARYRHAEESLALRRSAAATAREKAAEALAAAREALMQSRREERVLEKVKDRRRGAHITESRRHEQREADDRPRWNAAGEKER